MAARRAIPSFLLAALAGLGCAGAVDPGEVAREDRPPPMVLDTAPAPAPEKPPATRLRETRSLGYAGDAPLTQVPRRPSMFDQERAQAPHVVTGVQPPLAWGYGAYGMGGPSRGAPSPAQPIGAPNLVWSPPTTTTGGPVGAGAVPTPGSAVSPLAPR